MINSLKTAILLSLVVLVLVPACSVPKKLSGPADQTKVTQPRIFSNGFQKALYKTGLQLYGRELSGMTFIKKRQNGYRVVMMSEFGLKYFDLEFKTGDTSAIIVHYMIDLLNHKPVVTSFKNLFGALFMLNTKTGKQFVYEAQEGQWIKVVKYGGKKTIYTFKPRSGAVTNITLKGIHQKKTVLTLGNVSGRSPGKIQVDGKHLKYVLTLIEP